ncbi:LOW QUALITY PROTEIN: hypothetical protein PanWU01x14_285480 [Parasponia andersonii]|uniref:Uncharacterized protein n=1 Tax=Parasponia andersonii TaxID=3476 RepID=A0A2P5AZI7_PARAD|nr:LOW QUALITY PROTEIN: hypothetical protein PanWU01x14_285480 [Parasponia andersonii]
MVKNWTEGFPSEYTALSSPDLAEHPAVTVAPVPTRSQIPCFRLPRRRPKPTSADNPIRTRRVPNPRRRDRGGDGRAGERGPHHRRRRRPGTGRGPWRDHGTSAERGRDPGSGRRLCG